jgi:hypothetical protein
MTTEFKGDEFKFPDEVETVEKPEIDIEIENDLPPARQKTVDEKDVEPSDDELKDYGSRVQRRMKKFADGYHEAKNAREIAEKERLAAEDFARAVYEENKKLKEQIKFGSEVLIENSKSSAQIKMEAAEKRLKEAFEQGDGEKLATAQREITQAALEMDRASTMRPVEVQDNFRIPERQPEQRVSPKTQKWVKDNSDWFGSDDEMTMLAMGLDKKLQKEYGADYVGSDEYFKTIDGVMRKRFPEYFDTQSEQDDPPEPKRARPADDEESSRRAKSASVVAPATRSTPPNRVKLKASQVALARKLGISTEEYAKQVAILNRGE